jgi:drug/metabolite transporter (DMT)-like permease
MCRRVWTRFGDDSESPTASQAERRLKLRGVALLLLSRVLIPAVDCLAKLLQQRYSVWQVLFGRFAVQFVVLIPCCLWCHGASSLRMMVRWRLLVRGLLQFAAVVFFYSSIHLVPLADASAVTFLAPVVQVAIAAVVLRERVGLHRWIAVATGGASILVIVRPGFAHWHPAFLLLLLCAFCIASYNVMTRLLRAIPPLVIYGSQVVLGAVPLALSAPSYLVAPGSVGDAALMVLLGCIALVAHGMVILAYRCAEASLLAPLFYTEILMQAALGYLIFGDVPDCWTWVGIGLVIAVGVYLSITEAQGTASSSSSANEKSGGDGVVKGSGTELTAAAAAEETTT